MAKEGPTADCRHAARCPGCPLIQWSMAASARAKQQRVIDSVARFTDVIAPSVDELRRVGAHVAYRQRAKLVADEAGHLGLYRAGTHDVEDLPGCVVLDPLVQATVGRVREHLGVQPILRGVDVVRVDDGTLVTLIVPERASDEAVRDFADALVARAPSILGVARSERSDGAVQLLGSDLRVLHGAGRARRALRDDGPFTFVSHGSFVQAHREVAAAIHDVVIDALHDANIAPPARVLELYAGSGALALRLARAGFSVTAIESFAPACQQLLDAASEQDLCVEVETADAAQGVTRLLAAQRTFEAILVNPPRRGLDPEGRSAIARLRPRLVTYVSCEPDTLARDLSHFAALGFAVKALTPFDMMPLTEQVETVAILVPSEQTPLDVLHEDEGWIAINKRPFDAVTAARAGEDSLLDRVRARDGFEAAICVAPLEREASGISLFARDGSRVAEIEAALARGTVAYRALVRGIVRNGGKISRALDGDRSAAITRFRRQGVVAGHSLISATPLGGERPQQLARHLSAIGHPVLGATRHGDARSNRYLQLKHMLQRAFLHREHITLQLAAKDIALHAPLAPDLALTLSSLRNERATRPETP